MLVLSLLVAGGACLLGLCASLVFTSASNASALRNILVTATIVVAVAAVATAGVVILLGLSVAP